MSPKSPRKELHEAKKGPEDVTLVSLLLDESGSMDSCKGATISGFNEYIQGLKAGSNEKAKAGQICFTFTKFNSDGVKVVHNGIGISKVANLNDASFKPASVTPLYDAIGRTIVAIDKQIEEDKKTKKYNVLMVIMTDGMENASKEYDQKKIADLISKREKDGWTFAYLGANQDAWEVGASFGMSKGNTMTYDTADMRAAFSTLTASSLGYYTANAAPTKSFFNEPKNLKEEK